MDVSHNFRFRWNDHVPHLSQIFSELRLEEVYCDTTLITDDGFVLKAHGAVLTATSRYFERVLSDVTPEQHPIIVLKGANFTELSCLLDYIYQGVTQVDQNLMESVLDVADMLEIKGLSNMKNNISIRKLIAPSPSSSMNLRSSPLCSSPSKSPNTPSHHQLSSCPSSPNDNYVPPPSFLKTDAEETNGTYDAQKNKHTFVDKISASNSRLIENSDYVANSSKHSPLFSSPDYLDQTLGIDLSLSRATNEENERNSIKNLNFYEDTPLRKRKLMKASKDVNSSPSEMDNDAKLGEKKVSEDTNPSPNDLDGANAGDKVDDLAAHKKKKFFGRPVFSEDTDSSDFLEVQYNQKCGAQVYLVCEDNSSQEPQRNQKAEANDPLTPVMAKDFSFSENETTYYSDPLDPLKIDLNNDETPGVADSIRCIKQNPLLLASQIYKEKTYCQATLQHLKERAVKTTTSLRFIPKHVSSNSVYSKSMMPHNSFLLNPNTSRAAEMPKSSSDHGNGMADSVPMNRVQPKQALRARNPQPSSDASNDITDYVSVNILESKQNSNNVISHQTSTQQAFQAIDSRLKRPTTTVKRPLSKYTLFMKETYRLVAKQNPEKRSSEIVKIVSSIWNEMSAQEKQHWEEKAGELYKEFKARNPDYAYCPYSLQKLKREYIQRKSERRNMFKIVPFSLE